MALISTPCGAAECQLVGAIEEERRHRSLSLQVAESARPHREPRAERDVIPSRECGGGGAGHGCILRRLGFGARAAVVRERAEPAREMLPSLASSPGRVQELYTLTSTKSGTVVYAS